MCRGLATRFYRYRSGGVVVHAYQTPGTLSPNLCYWSSSMCGVCFTKIISLSLSFLFLSAINHMISSSRVWEEELQRMNFIWWETYIYLLVYSSKHIYKHVCYYERLGYCFYNVIHMHHFLYCITYLNVSQWHIGVQKVKNINIVKQKYLSEMNLIVWW